MIKVFFLIFEPRATWEKIARVRHGFAFVLCVYLMPMILISSAVEGWGLARWGKWQPRFEKIKIFSVSGIVSYEAVQAILLLLMVLVSSLIILKISQTFQTRSKFLDAFTTVAYGCSPLLFAHLLDAGPSVSPWTPWIIGILLTIWVIYQGIPNVIKPDPTHAFGLYLSASIVIFMTSGMTRLLTALYLQGEVNFHHSWLTRQLPNLFQ